jgi:prepilin-type N-terminal cleavage/methylation domain-containing protein
MKTRKKISRSGFTLIEIILAILVIAFFASMMVSYFGIAISQSSTPIVRLNKAQSLNQILEKITAQNNQLNHWRPGTTYAANTIILPTTPIRNGYQYTCTAGGTSGTREPGWPIASGGTIADNSVQWTRSSNCAPVLDSGSCPSDCTCQTSLQSSIGTEGQEYSNSFGNYRVIQNRFIKFDASNQEVNINDTPSDPAYGRFLKVTIGFPQNTPNWTGETRMTLFVMR